MTLGELQNIQQNKTYLFEEIEINTISLFFSNKEISLLESGRDSSDIHCGGYLGFDCIVVLIRMLCVCTVLVATSCDAEIEERI